MYLKIKEFLSSTCLAINGIVVKIIPAIPVTKGIFKLSLMILAKSKLLDFLFCFGIMLSFKILFLQFFIIVKF